MATAREEEMDELARFREEWKAEVRARTTTTAASIEPTSDVSQDRPIDLPPPETRKEQSKTAAQSKRPVELYRMAVNAEEQGLLDEALTLYRQAFRRDPQVDKAFHREEMALAASQEPPKLSRTSSAERDAHQVTRGMRELNIETIPGRSAELEALLAAFPDELVFIAQDEKTLSPMQFLPLEVIVEVLLHLAFHNDVNAIERFASICRKARAVSLDPVIWRYMVARTYVPPQIPREDLIDDIASQYHANYRQLYIEYPRLRLDGVYIAVCHYVRSGLSENAWVNLTHLITYHRYLRFLPGGGVLSLLANEDANPQEVVHLLKLDSRMKGLMRGKWRLDGTTVSITDLEDPSSPRGKYAFQMILGLRSRPLGRWNKLDLLEYDSVEKESGEACAFPLKHERPFWFSKVKSY